MSWSVIAAAVVVAILIISLIWSINRTLENNREQRRMKIAGIQRRCGSYTDLLNSIPLFYLGKDLAQYALEQIISLQQEWLELEPGQERVQQTLLDAQGKLQALSQQASIPAHKIGSPVEAQNIRQSLISAARLIQNLHNNKEIEINKARQLLNHIRSKTIQIQVDLLIGKAEDARREAKLPVAILMYQRAFDEIKQMNASPEKTALQERIQKMIDELNQQREQQEQAEMNHTGSGPGQHHASQLEEEFDKSLKEEDSWKKRAY